MKTDSNAEEFDQIAREVFAPIYPVIARQILERYGFTRGICLDVGCGSGYLGMAMAELSTMEIYMLDNDPEMLAIAQRNLDERRLESRVRLVEGDVHQIPLDNGSVDLAISRGSVHFWDDQAKAFSEIYRVLSPGGLAYIGGGFGSPELKEQIDQEMLRRDPEWLENTRRRLGYHVPGGYHQALTAAEIPDFEIDQGGAGRWIIFRKSSLE